MNPWIQKPKWFEIAKDEWELSGPFFSVSCMPISEKTFLIIFSTYNDTERTRQVDTSDLEIAKNHCTIWYNQILSEMEKANQNAE